MISLDNLIRTAEIPRVAELDTSALSTEDVLKLILQRSEIIRDQDNYNRYIKAWQQGKNYLLVDLIDRMGKDTLIRRAAAVIYLEYMELRPILDKTRPKVLADIGCGYAFFDLFVAQDFDTKVLLIDLETNGVRHFGFENTGAAYSNLDVAARLLQRNGVKQSKIETMNPSVTSVDDLRNIDMAVSFISCGYHYPWQTYDTFFRNSVKFDGNIILDIRKRKMKNERAELDEIGTVKELEAGFSHKAARILISKVPHNKRTEQ